ncbi:hypothetical protein B0I35DRAFT_472940 [Stachybotrys elegans]|uniref:Uncharacterized protein n=1 Tax=Stachybotrys elegans TaxID=80388 RepID=A0A8K0WW16_9HYPO|nr:hypothetical protein B0I35DRAFT_472940 [Stachybotrys elegans]
MENHRPQLAGSKPSPLRIVKQSPDQQDLYIRHRSSEPMQTNTGSPSRNIDKDWSLSIMKKRGAHTLYEKTAGGEERYKPRGDHCVSLRANRQVLQDITSNQRNLSDLAPAVRARRQRRPFILDMVDEWAQLGHSPITCTEEPEQLGERQPEEGSPLSATVSTLAEGHTHHGHPYDSDIAAGGLFVSSEEGPARNSSACVLSPSIYVVAHTAGLRNGQRVVWAAVEISGRLSQPGSHQAFDGSRPLDRFFEFGCMYDLNVRILPTARASIVQVFHEEQFPTTIHAGSSILLLVHAMLDSREVARRRQHSEELIEDLELQLGESRVEYMDIYITYSHSAFPEHKTPEVNNGICSLQSRMETTATASLKICDTFSPWSPQPASASNPLWQLLERH